MKVLIVSHTYISAVNRDKWNVLAQRYPQVQLIVIFPKRWPSCLFMHQATASIHQETNCSFIALDTFKEGNELLYSYAPMQLFRIMKKFRPDIIQVEQGDGALSYCQINLFAKILRLKAKSVFFTWINWQPKHSLKSRLYLSCIEKINLNFAHGAIAGNNAAQMLLHKKGFSKPILTIPQLGINKTLFSPPQPDTINRSSKYIGFVGRFTEEKGIFYLVRTFLKLANNFPDWKLVFIGKGPAEQRLQGFVASKQMLNRIEFCKPVPHETIAHYLRKIDILVLPSYDTPLWREQFGHVLIEAMASNVPVIGSNAGEIPHVIGNSGLIFKQRDEADLLAQLKTLMQDDELRKKLGARGYHRAHEEFSHEAIADKTYGFWQQLIAAPLSKRAF